MHNTTGTCRHNGLPLWLVLCIEERGQEHRSLTFDQLELFEPDDGPAYLLYTENASKNNTGGLAQRKVQPKQVPMHPILKGALYSCSKNTANIAHQSKKPVRSTSHH